MLIQLTNATLRRGDNTLISNFDFKVDSGEFVYIVGKVGTGKSSLLAALYGELPIQADEASILDFNLLRLKHKHIPSLRKRLGIIFQDFKLLSHFTVGQNLEFVLRATGWKKKLRAQRVDEVLGQVGLTDKLNAYPHELSGGEQQRVCIARALLNNPEIILADEPTGNLDPVTSNEIMQILHQIRERGAAIVMVTHNHSLLQHHPGIVYQCAEGHMADITSVAKRE